jgi:hypothetical protein
MSKTTFNFANLLSSIPTTLRNELVKAFNEIARNYQEQRWEPSELNGGKFCEVVYTILKGYTEGIFPPKASKPKNIVDACNNLEKTPSLSFPRSVRIQIPRMIIALYEIRNNRGVGHVGGDVDPNHMDATAVLYMVKWIMAELIRLLHNVDTYIATEAVERLTDRTLPILWKVGEKIRVLDTTLTMTEKTLVILYYHQDPVAENSLVDWVEHTNPSVYRRDILKKAHGKKLIEYDEANKQIIISPKGIKYVEENINLKDF